MLLPDNIYPELSIYYNASLILKELRANGQKHFIDLYQTMKFTSDMSISTFILCLDWLYLIEAIVLDEREDIRLCL